MIFVKRIFAPDIYLRLRSLLRFFVKRGPGYQTIQYYAGVPLPLVNRVKFAPVVFARSFRSHCPTVGPNFSMAVKHYPPPPRSSDRVWHVRLPPITSDYHFPPTQVLQLARFYVRFSC